MTLQPLVRVCHTGSGGWLSLDPGQIPGNIDYHAVHWVSEDSWHISSGDLTPCLSLQISKGRREEVIQWFGNLHIPSLTNGLNIVPQKHRSLVGEIIPVVLKDTAWGGSFCPFVHWLSRYKRSPQRLAMTNSNTFSQGVLLQMYFTQASQHPWKKVLFPQEKGPGRFSFCVVGAVICCMVLSQVNSTAL